MLSVRNCFDAARYLVTPVKGEEKRRRASYLPLRYLKVYNNMYDLYVFAVRSSTTYFY